MLKKILNKQTPKSQVSRAKGKETAKLRCIHDDQKRGMSGE